MDVNKDKIANQLNKRHKERQDQLSAKHELTKQNTSSAENVEHFQETFKNRVLLIEEGLAILTPNTDKIKLTQNILKIVEDIQNLQSYLTCSTFFLSNYTIKVCQQNVNDLKSQTEAVKVKLLTKKKFNFRSKVESTTKSITTVDSAEKESIAKQSNRQNLCQINWTVQNRANEEIQFGFDETNNKDITISCLNGCLVKIYGYPSSLQLSKLVNCVVLCGPISRSLLADSCENCKLVFGCQQLRLHNSHHCDLYMHVTCRAIIEDCNNISVAPYNYGYENIDVDFSNAGLDMSKNNWDDVADFNWLSTDVKSPNWNCIAQVTRISDWDGFLKEFRDKYL